MKLPSVPGRLDWVQAAALVLACGVAGAAELAVEDFAFDGALGSEGAVIERLDTNHFKVTLGHAPGHPDWANMVQFRILRHASGNALRLDVVFHGGSTYRFNDYSYSWSYDNVEWQPVHWQNKTTDSSVGDTLLFPTFAQDTVYVGHQVPMPYEMVDELVHRYEADPDVTLHVMGQSRGGRNLYRLEITDADSPPPRTARWVHYFANQHPGEHNAQWRMVGMIDWLLSDAGADCRRRSICHFVLMSSPDAPSHGWYRVCSEGVDMNRSYRVEGASAADQPHEAYVLQRDLEVLMASDTPATDVWSMHTWQGIVEPIIEPGPEMGSALPEWTALREAIEANDPDNLVKPLTAHYKGGNPTYWSNGPHLQFGITSVLCEGGGAICTKSENEASGAALMKGIAQYYEGTRTGTGKDERP
ncbi:MAG TPA: M14 family zinc carboxypeptidase [Candidatus Hydrogenedentes bacterium]|nr:M14 family zinc carboxypeptidase [Candidatus Hydrogenedentota bacterium]